MSTMHQDSTDCAAASAHPAIQSVVAATSVLGEGMRIRRALPAASAACSAERITDMPLV